MQRNCLFLGDFSLFEHDAIYSSAEHSINFTSQVKFRYIHIPTVQCIYTYLQCTHTYTYLQCTMIELLSYHSTQAHSSNVHTLYTAPTSSLQGVRMYAHLRGYNYIGSHSTDVHRCVYYYIVYACLSVWCMCHPLAGAVGAKQRGASFCSVTTLCT